MKKKSSLTILRKDNEVKLKEEIKLVCNERKDRESIVSVVDYNFKATSKNENKCLHTIVLVIHFKEIHTERRLQEQTVDA